MKLYMILAQGAAARLKFRTTSYAAMRAVIVGARIIVNDSTTAETLEFMSSSYGAVAMVMLVAGFRSSAERDIAKSIDLAPPGSVSNAFRLFLFQSSELSRTMPLVRCSCVGSNSNSHSHCSHATGKVA